MYCRKITPCALLVVMSGVFAGLTVSADVLGQPAISSGRPGAMAKEGTRLLPHPVKPIAIDEQHNNAASKKASRRPPQSFTPVDKKDAPAPTAFKVVNGKIVPLPGRIYQGAFADFGGEEDQVNQKSISTWEEKIGRKIGIVTFSLNFGDAITYPRQALALVHKNKAVPLVRLMPRANFDKPKAGVTPKYSLASIVAGRWDAQLTALAGHFKAFDVPVFMDFAPEMNGDWFHWSGAWNGGQTTTGYGNKALADGPELFRDAYRHIIDLFRKVGADKVTWIFHVDSYDVGTKGWNAIKNYYPGGDYIDWLGVSVYGSHEVDDKIVAFDSLMGASYQSLTNLDPNKPVILSEFGASEVKIDPLGKAKWIKAAGKALVSQRYPNMRAISYWHENFHSPGAEPALLRLDSSYPALSMYRIFISNDVFFP